MPIKTVTAHLVTHNGHRRWCVIIPRSLADGKLKRKFFRGRDKAEQYAAAIEGMRQDRIGGYDLLSVQDRAQVGRLMAKLGGSVDELGRAVDFYLQHNPKETRLVVDLVHEFIADRQRMKLREKYITPLRNSLLGFSLRFGQSSAQEIRPEEISKWVHSNGWAPDTVKTQIKHLRAMLNYALKRRYVAHNAAEAVEMPKTARKAPGIFTPEDAERLLRAAERWDRGLIQYLAFVLFGGLRPDESEAVRPEFMRDGILDLPAHAGKNNKRRLVEFSVIASELRQSRPCTLERWLAVADPFDPKNLRKRMDAIRDATAIHGDPERVPAVKWCNDIMRHSFVSYAVPIAGVSMTAFMADHSESVLKKNYRELVTRADSERFWSIAPST